MRDFTVKPEPEQLIKIYENDEFLTYAKYQEKKDRFIYQDIRFFHEIEINKNMTWEYTVDNMNVFSGYI